MVGGFLPNKIMVFVTCQTWMRDKNQTMVWSILT